MFIIGHLLLVTCVASQEIDCPSGDGVAHLQTQKGRSLSNDDDVDPCLADINTGLCQSSDSAEACTGCDGGSTIPSNAKRFPTGSLLCDDAGAAVCRMSDGSNPPYTFADANDFLECENDACFNFNVENVGALCCFGRNPCQGSSFSLASHGYCTKDACCHGDQACAESRFTGIKSLSCRPNDVEEETDMCVASEFEMSGDLYCKNRFQCDGAVINFEAYQHGEGEHCIRCLDDACLQVTGVFANPGSSNVFCLASGFGEACLEAEWTIPSGKSVRMNCEGELSCIRMVVTLTGTLDLICNGNDACINATIVSDPGALCSCTELNGGKCPENCQDDVSVTPPSRCLNEQQEDFDEDTACCAGAGGCEDCGCKGPYRRHRRAVQRARRAGRAQRRTGRQRRYDTLEGKVSLWQFGRMDKEAKSAHRSQQKQPVDFKNHAHGA